MNKLIGFLISTLISVIPPTFFKDELKTFLDSIEKKILNSPSQVDDLALPVIQVIRKQLGV